MARPKRCRSQACRPTTSRPLAAAARASANPCAKSKSKSSPSPTRRSPRSPTPVNFRAAKSVRSSCAARSCGARAWGTCWRSGRRRRSQPGSSVRDFSAACYYFARELQKTVDVPMGLIESAWGGARIQPWISPAALRSTGGFGRETDVLAAYAKDRADGAKRWGDPLQRAGVHRCGVRHRAPRLPAGRPRRLRGRADPISLSSKQGGRKVVNYGEFACSRPCDQP